MEKTLVIKEVKWTSNILSLCLNSLAFNILNDEEVDNIRRETMKFLSVQIDKLEAIYRRNK